MVKRLNATLTNSTVDEVMQLRELLEARLKQRLSIAQVLKRLIKMALIEETVHSEQSKIFASDNS
jgi:hypothetical protein